MASVEEQGTTGRNARFVSSRFVSFRLLLSWTGLSIASFTLRGLDESCFELLSSRQLSYWMKNSRWLGLS